MKNITIVHPILPPKHVPVSEMMEYLIEGWSLAEDQPDEPLPQDMKLYGSDVDATDAVDRDVANYLAELSKENICSALEQTSLLNAAIAHLGDLQTADELANGTASHLNGKGFSAAYARTGRRLWQWVTGKDAKTGEERWPKKCITHTRANGAFQRQTRNYEFDTAVELAKHVCLFHWKQLSFILDADYIGPELPTQDEKKKSEWKPSDSPNAWFDISGAKVLAVKGGGTQILWDSRKMWLPSSQIKKMGGSLSVPMWLAQKNEMN